MPFVRIMQSSTMQAEENDLVHPLFYRSEGRAHMLREALKEMHLSERDREILKEIEEQSHDPDTPFAEINCVSCGRPFMIVQADGKDLDYCPHCSSCWLYPTELKGLTHLGRDIPAEHCKSRESHYECPYCQTHLTEFVFLRPFSVMVFRCPHGHGIYLEDHVLERILEVC